MVVVTAPPLALDPASSYAYMYVKSVYLTERHP
jgi:hypothetical protein